MENIAGLVQRALDLESRADIFAYVIPLFQVYSWFWLDYNFSVFPFTCHNYRNTMINILENVYFQFVILYIEINNFI